GARVLTGDVEVAEVGLVVGPEARARPGREQRSGETEYPAVAADADELVFRLFRVVHRILDVARDVIVDHVLPDVEARLPEAFVRQLLGGALDGALADDRALGLGVGADQREHAAHTLPEVNILPLRVLQDERDRPRAADDQV